MNRSRVLPVFTTAFALLYGLAEPFNLQLFMYYPAIGEFAVAARPESVAGPPINWYGWMGFATAGAVAASAVSLVLPRTWESKVWPVLSWLAPLLATGLLVYLARMWFL